jgi:hypothetical protein
MSTRTNPTMRDAYENLGRTSLICACCQREIVTAIEGLFYNPPNGSPQRFCSHACRQAAYRRRQAGTTEATPRQRQGGRNRNLNQLHSNPK